MITDDIPEIARARRLGHHADNRIAETYSHVSGEIHQRLLASLEHRWHTAPHQCWHRTADRPIHARTQ
ncbi:hypothetical protein [Amycolatopsis sp. GM8]|uniref:hypothetical protein n=1 Tax=Amycolatopsis sp. GM8 TaxID=2896530 RepID=UPI001F27ED05|nr:hypothetical protein [Amycolatopsis sp. GM8]